MLIMDGAQIDFDPWRSNLRKSSAVEYSGVTLISRSVLCTTLLQTTLQIDISIRILKLILYSSSGPSEKNEPRC